MHWNDFICRRSEFRNFIVRGRTIDIIYRSRCLWTTHLKKCLEALFLMDCKLKSSGFRRMKVLKKTGWIFWLRKTNGQNARKSFWLHFWDIPFRNFIPRVCTEMTLFAGGLNSETLFTRKHRDGFFCRGDQSFVEYFFFFVNNYVMNTFCDLGVLFWDLPFRNFIPRVWTEMTLFAGGLNSETLLSGEEPLILFTGADACGLPTWKNV